MIIIVANIPFPSNNAMSLRIGREAEILSEKEGVVIVCRKAKNQPKKENILVEGKKIEVHRFELNYVDPRSPYYLPVLSELFRAFRTFFALSFSLVPLLWKNKGARIHAVSSPETIPFFCYFFAKAFGGKPFAVRFDDLGPEVGQEAKGTSESSLIVRINKSIEKFICKKYEKIISYSYGITEKIMKRDSVGREKIVTIFMTPRKIRKKRERDVGKKSQKKPFLIVYTGSLQNYEFVLKGFKKLFFSLKKIKEKKIDFALHVAGEGKARRALIEMGRILGLEENVFFRGELSRKGIDSLLRQADAAIVPLPHSSHMQQTFPTRVLEYLSLGKAIIAPDYGEFARCFKHKENAILYNERSEEDLTEKILELMKEKKLKQRIEKNALWLFETQFNQKEMEERLRRIYFEN